MARGPYPSFPGVDPAERARRMRRTRARGTRDSGNDPRQQDLFPELLEKETARLLAANRAIELELEKTE